MDKNKELLNGLFGEQVESLSEENTKIISDKLDKLIETRVDAKVKFQTEVAEADAKEKYDALLTEAKSEFEGKVTSLEQDAVTLAESYKQKLQGQVKSLSEELTEAKEKEVSEFKKDLVEKLDKYLQLELGKKIPDTYVESMAQVSVLEPIVEGIKNTFKDNYMKLDSENFGLLRDAKEEIVAAREEQSRLVQESMDLNAELKSLKRSVKISEVCEGLTDAQSERAKTLLESYDLDEIDERFGMIQNIIIEGVEEKAEEKEEETIGEESEALADTAVKSGDEEEKEGEEKEEVVEESKKSPEQLQKLNESKEMEDYVSRYREMAGLT